MNKNLTTKIQKINPKLAESTNNISNCLVIEPDDTTILEKKGTVYTAFDVSSKEPNESLFITKIVNDILHDAYFQSESASPIQSIEKSILKLRDNIVKGTDTVFNIATAVLWGNTLYLVQYGSTKIYLMRDGKIKPIEAATEGNFSVASGVVKDGDVVLLATKDFAEKYPLEQLITGSGVSPDELKDLQTGLLLKFEIIKEFSEDEAIDFTANTGDTNNKDDKDADKSGMPKMEQTFKTSKQNTEKERAKRRIQKIAKETTSLTSVVDKRPKWIIIASIGLAVFLIFAVGNLIAKGMSSNKTEETDVVTQLNEDDNKEEKVEEAPQVEDLTALYDLKITDADFVATNIAVIGNNLFVSDATSKKIYSSAIDSIKFIALDTDFGKVNNLFKYDDVLALTNETSFKSVNPTTGAVLEGYTANNFDVVATYLDFIYTISGNTLTKYTKDEGALTSTVWATSPVFEDAVSMGIDFSIYVLKKNGEIVSFTSGAQDTFEITGIDEPLKDPVQIVVNTDLTNMYVADKGNRRIVVLTKEGAFVKAIKPVNEGSWDDMKGIAVNDAEDKVYVLSGSRVYEVEL